jgi:hypothetical protein
MQGPIYDGNSCVVKTETICATVAYKTLKTQNRVRHLERKIQNDSLNVEF